MELYQIRDTYLRQWQQLTARVEVGNLQSFNVSVKIETPDADNLTPVELPDATIAISRNSHPPSWGEVFNSAEAILTELEGLYRQAEQEGFRIFPTPKELFNAYWQTPLYSINPTRPWQRVRVVIIGQDPYPQYDEIEDRPRAMGLCFSNTIGRNKSLINIFKEIKDEYPDFNVDRSPNLIDWARQGVLMLNYSLVVIENDAGGKRTKDLCAGSFKLTLEAVSRHNPRCKYLLWGLKSQKAAQRCLTKVSAKYLFESAHPSSLSAHRGFFGNGHFKKVNDQLIQEGDIPIKW